MMNELNKTEEPVDDDACPKSPTKKHEPDWNSTSITCDIDTYVDVNCLHCGRSGCIGKLQNLVDDIMW